MTFIGQRQDSEQADESDQQDGAFHGGLHRRRV
jgi:hypothetical protein